MDVLFVQYKNWINKYINNHDTREINFQNDVVKRLLENMFHDYDIVSVDTKGSGSKNHDYYTYSGEYTDECGRKKPTTPDLLICKNWDWYNINNDNIKYIATIEVKSPCGSEAIYKKDFYEYNDSWKNKIDRHLSAKKIKKVIFTDTLKWEFYEYGKNEPEIIMLVNRVPYGRGYSYTWCDDADFKFAELVNKLENFLTINKYDKF